MAIEQKSPLHLNDQTGCEQANSLTRSSYHMEVKPKAGPPALLPIIPDSTGKTVCAQLSQMSTLVRN